MKKYITLLFTLIFVICFNIITYAADYNTNIISNKLGVDDSNEEKMIYGFNLENNKITIKNILDGKYFEEDLEIKIFDIDGNEVTDSNKGLGTGSKIKLYQNEEIVSEYTTVIYGDITGDGEITAIDALALIKAINSKIDYTSIMCQEAGKIVTTDIDKKPTAIDALAIIKHLNGKYEIKQAKELFYWDKSSDANKDYVAKTDLNFKVIAKDINGNEIENITWDISEGTLNTDKGTNVNWIIPNVENTYTITAKKDDKNILEKEIKYMDIEAIINSADIDSQEVEIQENGDEDKDGLTNIEEYEMGTDIYYTDTDADGLNDYEEVKTYNTNPLEKDTDGDGIEDLNEILLSLNPLSKDTNDDGILDNEQEIEYKAENTELGISISMKGNANITDTQIDTVQIDELNNVNAVVSDIYSFYTSGELKVAEVEINYNEAGVIEKGISEENLSLYYFNPTDYTFEEVNTEVDTETNIAKATLEHFSMYILADKTTMISSLNNQIMFVIDNSASMYTMEQAIEKNLNSEANEETFKDVQANDPEYKRLDIVSKLVSELDDDFQYGLIKFTADDTTLSKMGSSKESIEKALEKIKTEGENFNGTWIGPTIYSAVSDFKTDSAFNRYIVLISDGEDTAPSKGIIKDWAISRAKDRNVKIITIGLGSDVNQADLKEYATETGGRYYHIDDVNMLESLYSSIFAELNLQRDTLTTENGKEQNYLVVADSGFTSEINGLPFKNYRSTVSMRGHCYGIAELAKYFYTGNLDLTGDVNRNYLGKYLNFNYDLTSQSTFVNNSNLANYKFLSEELEKIFKASNEELYDYEKIANDYENGAKELHLEICDKFKEYIEQTGGVIKIKEEEDTIETYGNIVKEVFYMDMEELTEENIEKFPDLQLFKAITYFYVSQYEEEGWDADTSNRKHFSEGLEALEETIEKINSGIPVRVGFQTYDNTLISAIRRVLLSTKTNHAVNGIRVLRNIENPNKYKIAIYNNNTPGETEYLSVDIVKTLFGTKLCCYEPEGHCTNIYVEK